MASTTSAIEQLFVTERSRLRRLIARIVGSRQDAEDVIQDTYLRLGDRDLTPADRGLVVSAAKNLALDHKRGHAVRTNFTQNVLPEQMTRQAAQPEEIVAARQDLADFLGAINTLPQRRAQIFLLARVDGMPYAQIAKALNISLSTVEKEMASALAFCHQWQRKREIS
ncbi:RNA polymerase sigma-70 factor (ECF subfamily) [Aminobacter aminovorans]|uniref:Probable RNA polymerase sigma factor fecI n=1 Tax=Aminobacter aminovorans TaxID=83263 RepID=A0A380WT93_AMIAI|nr:RNA polymerase sigma factor [Aminobacter aminovorans]TCS30525.1 RNA polymerase sigma-70 factor (ECF subfamily) [Aminobacter aminovorans]SUU91374.1 Probable RNA polymerase sigma factor fecI [Aminobacter aminovorans]